MKKTYFQPAFIVVELGTCKMMAESLPVGGENPITDPNEILTKENVITNKSLWDNEW